MRFDIITLFPEMIETIMDESIIGRAKKAGAIECFAHQLRDYAHNKHRQVDDTPYGGGMGMLLQSEPVFRAYEDVKNQLDKPLHVIYMSPQGEVLTQKKANYLAENHDNILILCGHYEGIDQRVLDLIVDEEISIGDYVLTGGELPAMVLLETVARLIPEVLSSDESFEKESHYNGLLEHPHYTKPQIWEDKGVPEVLLSGHHANIEKWRREKSLKNTAQKRPDMIKKAFLKKLLSAEDVFYLKKHFGDEILKEK